jgi:hypothetical protein
MPEALKERLPQWARTAFEWLLEPGVLVSLATASAILFVLSVAGVPWFVARLPTDYFTRHELDELGVRGAKPSGWRIAGRILTNAFGLLLFVAGVLMLVLPGQGVLTILVSLFFLDFPGKRKLERRLIGSRPVFRAINAIRRRVGRPPLERGNWV